MSRFTDIIDASLIAIESLRGIEGAFDEACALLVESLKNGGKVMACGNGGSAADSAHFMTELLCRLDVERPPLAGIALTNDGSFMTAVGNDYSFGEIFARQVTGLGKPGDVLIGMTTSGNSKNVLRAFEVATASLAFDGVEQQGTVIGPQLERPGEHTGSVFISRQKSQSPVQGSCRRTRATSVALKTLFQES